MPCGPDAAAWPDLRTMTAPARPVITASAADWPDLLPRQRQPMVARAEQIPAVALARPLPEILTRALAVVDAAERYWAAASARPEAERETLLAEVGLLVSLRASDG